MANYQLGPESPRPFAVLSENHIRRHIELPFIPPYERFSFGDAYERKMCELIHKYMELDTNDRLCYVGEPKGSLTQLLQSKFCLLKPITTVVPGHIHYEESPNHRMLPIKVANVGCEEFFRRATESGCGELFDKIFLNDVVRYLDNSKETYKNILQTLSEFGKVVIVQRPAGMNTLPMFNEAKDRLAQNEMSYLQIIKDLQASRMNVHWDIECLPIVMTKSKWYSMLKDRFPSEMEMVSPFEVTGGLRELSEGLLKYGDEKIEFVDRLLFITATRPIFSDAPQISRHGDSAHAPKPRQPTMKSMQYEMEVTDGMNELIKDKQRKDRMQGLKGGYNMKMNH